MNIYFSNVNFSSRTGPNTFAYRLAEELTRKGHRICRHDDEYDVFLAFIEPASRPNSKSVTVQRLDGIWFKPEDFQDKNVGIKRFFDSSDHVIWQTDFDRRMITHHWGERSGTVIHNGIRLERKDPIPRVGLFEKGPVFVSSSNWHPQKRLRSNIEAFKVLKKKYRDATLTFIFFD